MTVSDGAMSEAVPAPRPLSRGRQRLSIGSWILFDWANSVYPTIIVTFVFAVYFQNSIAPDPQTGEVLWSRMIAVAGLVVAVLSPLAGAVADQLGRQKPWIALAMLICAGGSLGLWFMAPTAGGDSHLIAALVLVAVSNIAFEFGQTFYNAMLPYVAPPGRLGRISGWGWAFGYVGGLVCLALCLVLLVLPGQEDGAELIFGLSNAPEDMEHIRAVAVVVGLWFLIFGLPMLLFTREQPTTGIGIRQALGDGLGALKRSIAKLPRHRDLLLFLIASAVYRDALLAIFAVSGLYTSAVFGMATSDLLIFAIALNVTSAAGAFALGWVDDWIGPKRTIALSCAGLILFGVPAVLTDSLTVFWIMGLAIGVFIGPIQAASRSLMVRLIPPDPIHPDRDTTNEFFGLYSLAGKATAFLGPLVYSIVTEATESSRWGLGAVLMVMGVGLVLLLPVREPPQAAAK